MLTLLFSLLSLFIAADSAKAAGPVFHIYMAERLFERFPQYCEGEKKRFVLGTLYPDIRYIAGIERSATHFKEVSIDEVLKAPTPFLAGMKFHSWVDNVRDEYVLSDGIYSRLPPELPREQKPSFLKVVEDELLLPKLNKTLCRGIFDRVDAEELAQGLTERVIERWHTFLLLFLRTSPKTTITLLSLFDKSKGLLKGKELAGWLSHLNLAIDSEAGKRHTEQLLQFFEQKLREAELAH